MWIAGKMYVNMKNKPANLKKSSIFSSSSSQKENSILLIITAEYADKVSLPFAHIQDPWIWLNVKPVPHLTFPNWKCQLCWMFWCLEATDWLHVLQEASQKLYKKSQAFQKLPGRLLRYVVVLFRAPPKDFIICGFLYPWGSRNGSPVDTKVLPALQ